METELKKSITSVLSRGQKAIVNDPISKQKNQQSKKYTFGKCWDRIQADGKFVLCQYSWLEQDRTGQFAFIMDQMYLTIQKRFSDYLVQEEIKDIEQFETDLNKTANKKKKKKNKKKGNSQIKTERQDKGQQSDINESNNQEKRKNDPNRLIRFQTPQKKSEQKDRNAQEKLLIISESKRYSTNSQADQSLSKINSTILKSEIKIAEPKQKLQLHSKKVKKLTKKKGKSSDNQYQVEGSIEVQAAQTLHINEQSQQIYLKAPEKQVTLSNKSQKIKSHLSNQGDKSVQFTNSTCKIQSSIHKIIDQNSQLQNVQQRHTTKTKQYETYYVVDKTSQISQQSQLSADFLKQKPKSKSLSKNTIMGVSMKKIDRKMQQDIKKQKIIQNVIGASLESYADNLMKESEFFQPTRKTAVDLLREFLQMQQIKCKWELIMFGSAQVGYALKQSDIDLVLRMEDPKIFSLKDFELNLKILSWVLDVQYISTANVPIITLKINLYQARRLSNRLIKKIDKSLLQNQGLQKHIQDFLITVDISMCGLKQQYGGIVSSNNLRFLFNQNEPLKKIIFILKDILRRKELNKPYHGGVNSYVLTMMIYGIIKRKQLQLKKSAKVDNQYFAKRKKENLQGLKTNLYLAFSQLCNFLKDFVPFDTLINPLDQKKTVQESIHLNIVDPFSGKLVKTSAFRIEEIIEEFQSFKSLLDEIRDEMKSAQVQSHRKIGKQISQRISCYIKELFSQPYIPKKGKSVDDFSCFAQKTD